jgi:iron(III) transport system ATP-binding protein
VLTRAFRDAVDHVVAVGKHEIRAREPSVSIEQGTGVHLRMDPVLALVPVD